MFLGLFLLPQPGLSGTSDTLTPVNAEQLRSVITSTDARLILVNFWSTWCVPCREEMPDLTRLQRTFADRGFRLIFVSMDFEQNTEAALDTLLAKGGSLPSYIRQGKDDPFIRGIHPNWSGVLPASFLYDSTGTLLDWWSQARSFEELKEVVLAHLQKE